MENMFFFFDALKWLCTAFQLYVSHDCGYILTQCCFFEKYFFLFDTFPNTCSLPPWLQNHKAPCDAQFEQNALEIPARRPHQNKWKKWQLPKWEVKINGYFFLFLSPLDCPLPHSAQGPLISPHGSSHKRPERLREIRRAGMLTSSLVATTMTMMMIGWKASSFATCNSHLIVIEVAINHRYHVSWWSYTVIVTWRFISQ